MTEPSQYIEKVLKNIWKKSGKDKNELNNMWVEATKTDSPSGLGPETINKLKLKESSIRKKLINDLPGSTTGLGCKQEKFREDQQTECIKLKKKRGEIQVFLEKYGVAKKGGKRRRKRRTKRRKSRKKKTKRRKSKKRRKSRRRRRTRRRR